MVQSVRHAAEALRLRKLTLSVLAESGAAAATAWEEAIALPGEAWRLFLEAERCAGIIAERVAALGYQVPRTHVLDESVTADVQRALSARSQAALIGGIARKQGWPVVVLKGTVAATQGIPIYQLDVDVLVKEEHSRHVATELARVLGGRGQEGRASVRHLPPLASPFALPVEVHTNIDNRWTGLSKDVWDRVITLDEKLGLRRLAPGDHVLHILTHMVIDHPDRRGRLRDTLLLAHAIRELPPETRDVERRIAGIPHGRALADQMAFARGLARGEVAHDPFEAAAFARYWMLERRRWWNPLRLRVWESLYPGAWHWVIALVSRWPTRWSILDGLHEPTARPSTLGATAWLERRAPSVGRGLRVSLRLLHYFATFLVAWPIAWWVRREAKRAGVRLRPG